MRYSKREESVLVGNFTTGTTVRIKILSLDTNEELILDDDLCIEHRFHPGVFMWSTKNINYSDKIDHYANLVYVMYNDIDSNTLGKLTYSGYLDENYETLIEKIDTLLSFKEQYDRVENKIDSLVGAIVKIDTLDVKADQILEFETRFLNIQEQLDIRYSEIMEAISNVDAKLI